MSVTNDDALQSLQALNAWLDAQDARAAGRSAAGALIGAMKAAPDDVVAALIARASNLHKEKHGKSPIGEAAKNGRLEALKALVAGGCDVNAVSTKPADKQKGDGYRPLLLAIQYGHDDCAEWLLENGAEHTFETTRKRTPLEYAESLGRAAVVKLLVKKKAGRTDPEELDLKAAARRGLLSRVEELIAEADEGLLSPTVAREAMWAALDAHQAETVEALLPHCLTRGKANVLSAAARSGRSALVKVALEAELEVDETRHGLLDLVVNNLVWERRDDALAALKRLLKAGANVNRRGHLEMTPVMNAARVGWLEACQALVDAGADVNAKDNKQWRLRNWAAFEYKGRDKTQVCALAEQVMAAAEPE